MRSFHDSERMEWNIALTLSTVKRVYEKTGVNLFNPVEMDAEGRTLSQRLIEDDLLLGQTVLALIEKQIEARKLTDETVGSLIGAEQLAEANKAFFEEYVDFFQFRGKDFLKTAIQSDYNAFREKIEKWNEEIDRFGKVGDTSNDLSPSQAQPITAT